MADGNRRYVFLEKVVVVEGDSHLTPVEIADYETKYGPLLGVNFEGRTVMVDGVLKTVKAEK